MSKPFIYGMSVEGEHFIDREYETRRLLLNFESGVNSILISPRRMGKTSLVKKVKSLAENETLKVVYMDIYKCRTAFEFYEKYASAVIQSTATKVERMIENAKEFLLGVVPKIVYSPEPASEISLSLGLNPHSNDPEEILNLPEKIARKRGIQIVVCIDEFQQIGEMPDSLTLQKTIRSVWQHHQQTSYCLFGSKRHMMSDIFLNRSMPFYQFGDLIWLQKIPTEDWIPYIISHFEAAGRHISETMARHICETVDNYPSYVQHLASIMLSSLPEGASATEDLLVPSVTIRADRSVLPEDGELLGAAQEGIMEAVA